MMNTNKESFGSRLGFILAAAGASVGLGNIWRFPYLAAEYGGGTFLIMYIFLAVSFGFTLTLTDLAIGRCTGKSVLTAYRAVEKRFAPLGWIAVAIPAIMLSYYCDIGGWVLRYALVYAGGRGEEAANAYFTAANGVELSFFDHFISGSIEPVLYFIVFLVITTGVIMFGVQKGIEKAGKIMMPMLLLMMVVLAIYMFTLEGASGGLKFYLFPDLTGFTLKRFFETFKAAFGQIFYSIGIAVGTLLTYGAYMRKEDSLEAAVHQIEIIDTGVAFLAGLIIIPSVFVFSKGDSSVLNSGAGLMFITMPKVFASLPGGGIIGLIFFVFVIFAALTSSIAIMEAVVYSVMERFGIGRRKSCLIVFLVMIPLGLLSVLGHGKWSEVTIMGMQFMDFFDYIISSVLIPVLALFTCVLIGYVAKPSYVEEEVTVSAERFNMKKIYHLMIRFLCPVALLMMLAALFL